MWPLGASTGLKPLSNQNIYNNQLDENDFK